MREGEVAGKGADTLDGGVIAIFKDFNHQAGVRHVLVLCINVRSSESLDDTLAPPYAVLHLPREALRG